jgi:N-glycosylase/DNA lyase
MVVVTDWSICQSRLHFGQIVHRLPLIRLMRQDPLACLFSFICSSNNSIPRIQGMVDVLAEKYGTALPSINLHELLCDMKPAIDCIPQQETVSLYCFPTLDQLLLAREESLRDLKFGYRAAFIAQAAKKIHELGGIGWINGLYDGTHEDVREALIQLPGVGPKVADCVALFSLEQIGVVPVDTHVWRIAQRDYRFKGGNTLTPAVHKQIGEMFKDKFGDHAGWAHSLLFASELPEFKTESRNYNGRVKLSSKRASLETEGSNYASKRRVKN